MCVSTCVCVCVCVFVCVLSDSRYVAAEWALRKEQCTLSLAAQSSVSGRKTQINLFITLSPPTEGFLGTIKYESKSNSQQTAVTLLA